jgi:hypothetical protein
MIVEQRTYRLGAGTVIKYLRTYETEGLPLQIKHLGRLVGYFVPASLLPSPN